VETTVESHLFDLLWIRRALAEGRVPDLADLLASLDAAIVATGTRLFYPAAFRPFDREPLRCDALIAFDEALRPSNAADTLKSVGWPHRRLEPLAAPTTTRELVIAYLTSPQVFEAGMCKITPRAQFQEPRLVRAMQEATIAAAEKKHIFVEANPTSNRIIGAFQNTKSLPFFKLAERLKVTLSTDDPTLTGSCLASEYEVVFHALCDSGKSHAAALAELDRFRQHGVAALFRDPEDSAHARRQLQPMPSGCRDCQEPRPRSR
jgi:hypothetical protein